jgi:hypothetical protein
LATSAFLLFRSAWKGDDLEEHLVLLDEGAFLEGGVDDQAADAGGDGRRVRRREIAAVIIPLNHLMTEGITVGHVSRGRASDWRLHPAKAASSPY